MTMSVTYTCDVFCDRCGDWTHGVCSDKPTGLASKALKIAKKEGWSRDVKSTFLDLCPNCLNEFRKEA
jgi:hypothetical protein